MIGWQRCTCQTRDRASRPLGSAKVSRLPDPDRLLERSSEGGAQSVGVPPGRGNSVGVWSVSPCTGLSGR